MISFKQFLFESKKRSKKSSSKVSHQVTKKDDGFVIKTEHGMIDFRPTEDSNEIWWVESKKKGHGSELVDLMQKHSPREAIAWGITSKSGEGLRKKWHRNNQHIQSITGPHEGQFDPF